MTNDLTFYGRTFSSRASAVGVGSSASAESRMNLRQVLLNSTELSVKRREVRPVAPSRVGAISERDAIGNITRYNGM
jgi:hypothetical protein